MKEKSIWQKIAYGIGICSLLACLIVYLVFGYIKLFCGEKFEDYNFYISTLTKASGEKENAIKIKYYKNVKKNGLECFEYDIGNFMDTSKKNIHRQGLQYVANSKEDSIEWIDFEYFKGLHEDVGGYAIAIDSEHVTMETLNTKRVGLWTGKSRAFYFSPYVNESTASKYEYQSIDNFASLKSMDPISKESKLLLEFGGQEDLVYMSLKYDMYANWLDGEVNATDIEALGKYESKSGFHNYKDYYYNNFSIDYFSYLLYNNVQTLDAGTKGTFVFPFKNIFNYYECDSNKNVGDELDLENTELVKKDIDNYYTVYVEVYEDGIQTADQSMFGVLCGSPSYKVDGATGETGDYFTGRQIIDLDSRHFNKVLVNGNDYAFKLRDDVLNAYLAYKNKISLRITIDENALSQEGINFVGFTSDSGLEKFRIEETVIIPISAEVTS